jgi:hypothetical protein
MNSANNFIFLPHWLASEQWRTTPIVMDDANSLINPSLHDAELLGLIQVDKHQHVFLFVQPGSGNRIALVLQGVVLLRADNFCQGNIVLDVAVEIGDQTDLLSIKNSLKYLHRLADIKAEKALLAAGSVIDKQLVKIQSGEFLILTISPSYGCELVALCERIEAFVMS